MVGEQMTLFGESESEWNNESHKSKLSEWSYSRRGALEQCPRKYYYQYYGSNRRTAKNDPQKEKLRFLKKLQNRHLRSGDILHFVIRWYLKKLQQGKQLSLDWLLQWALDTYRKDIKYSQQYEHGTALSNDIRHPKLLLEFYYGLPDAESLCADTEKRLITALTNFITSQNLAQFRKSAGKVSVVIEDRAQLKEVHFTLTGRVDLAYREGDNVVVVDWKIGSSGSSDDSLQMLAYALWAKQKFECPLDSLTLHKVYLEDNTISTFHVNEKDIARVEARILQDLEWMQEADNFGRRGLVEAFTPCAQPKVCALCQFQEICPKE